MFISEIALNPDWLGQRSNLDILSTVVHEMCHLERLILDNNWTGSYHCTKWVAMMERVGLTPMALVKGKPNGKKTGHHVTHVIVDGGPFDKTARQFLKQHPNPFPIEAVTSFEDTGLVKKNPNRKSKVTSGGSRTSKFPFCCPKCDARIYGKKDTRAWCSGSEEEIHELTLFAVMVKKQKKGV